MSQSLDQSLDKSRNKNFKNLQLKLPAFSEPLPPQPVGQLELSLVGLEGKLPVHASDTTYISELGFGNGGSVKRVLHRPTGVEMACKTVMVWPNERVQTMIKKELKTLHMCHSRFIVEFYSYFMDESSVIIYMEYMDCGSLEKIYRRVGPIPENIIASINASVVDGLRYLMDMNVIHRDIKPSNILLNRRGDVKICDFGVSTTLSNSVAASFIGTSTYMSPERISGEEYSSSGDIWSLGISLIELESAQYPYEHVLRDEGDGDIIFALLQYVTTEPAPTLPPHCSSVFRDYVARCLQRRPQDRLSLNQITQHPFYATARPDDGRMKKWAFSLRKL